MDYYNEDGDSNIDYSNRTGNQPELDFQTFDPSETAGVPRPELGDIELEDFGDTESNTNERERSPPGDSKFWHLSYYQHLADVDTLEVGKRIGSAFFPLKDFFALISGNPDLYGWFWISTTLIFAVAAAGNFASYLTYAINDQLESWSFDFAKLGFGATMIYLYVTLCPFLAFVALKLWLELKPGILEHFCIYGYSLAPYIPAAVVMIIPINYVRWIIMLIACAIVCAFLIRNYLPVIRDKPMEGGVTLLVIVLVNILFALLLQFFFFQYAVEKAATDSSDSSDVESSAVASSVAESSIDESSIDGTSVSSVEYSTFENPSESESPLPQPSPSETAAFSESASETFTPTPSMTPTPSISATAAVVESETPVESEIPVIDN